MFARRSLMGLGLVAASLGATGLAWAQAYPNKVIRLQVPFAPGGTTDIIARVMSEPLGKALGQSVVVKTGPVAAAWWAPASWPARSARRVRAGHGHRVDHGRQPGDQPQDPLQHAHRLHAHHQHRGHAQRDRGAPQLPGQGLQGAFVAELKKNPGKYSYASSGTGGIGHLQTELFKSLAGVFMTHIPYRGAGPALNDTVGGQVPIIFDNLPSALPHIKAGRLVPIVVAAPQRLAVPARCAHLQGDGAGAGQPHGLLRHHRPQGPAQGRGGQGLQRHPDRAQRPGRAQAHRGHRLADRRQHARAVHGPDQGRVRGLQGRGHQQKLTLD
jgi:hypothetical protein